MPLKNGKTTTSLQTILVGSVIPPGTIAPFGGGTVPAGWLLCDGSIVSRSTYSSLFSAVGTVHGQGDGSTTFHLPDYRGRFLRGADNMGTGAAGRDPDAASRTAANTGGATGNDIGSVQSDAMQGHRHGARSNPASLGDANAMVSVTTNGFAGRGSGAFQEIGIRSDGVWAITEPREAGNGTPRTTAESRPQNANTAYIIKV
jgi:microcystin-dependent protein